MNEQDYSSVVYALKHSFNQAMLINDLARSKGVACYCLSSVGLQSFMFADLGSDTFEYQVTSKGVESV